MAEDERRSPIPMWLFIGAIAVAVLTTSALIWFLFQRTEGPAPTLRTFAERVAEGDCKGTYEMLDDATTAIAPFDEWCEKLPGVADALPPDFEVEEMILRGDIAEVTLENGKTWLLRKVDGDWRVIRLKS